MKARLTGGQPRIRFFKSKEDWEKYTVDANTMTIEQMQELLRNLAKDPNYNAPKDSVIDVLMAQAAITDDIVALLKKFGVERSDKFDETVIPLFRESDDDVPNNKKFDIEEFLKGQAGTATSNPKETVGKPEESAAAAATAAKSEL